jgi:hypothetical protein
MDIPHALSKASCHQPVQQAFQPELYANTLGQLDNLNRTFKSQIQRSRMPKEVHKAIILHQVREAGRMMPALLDSTRLTNACHTLATMQTDYRNAKASHDPHAKWYEDVVRDCDSKAGAMHAELVCAIEHAQKLFDVHAIARAIEADGTKHEALVAFPTIRAVAGEAQQLANLANLADTLNGLYYTSQKVYQGKLSPTRRGFEDTLHHEILTYLAAGGDLAARDAGLYSQLKSMYEYPRNGAPLWDLASSLKQKSETINNWQERLIRAYKADRAEIRKTPQSFSRNALEQTSALLDVVYAARWTKMAESLRDNVYDARKDLSNPAVTANLNGAAIRHMIREAVEVPAQSFQR